MEPVAVLEHPNHKTSFHPDPDDFNKVYTSNLNETGVDYDTYNEVITYQDYPSLHGGEADDYDFGDRLEVDEEDESEDYEDYDIDMINDYEMSEEDMAYESSHRLTETVLALDLGYHIHQGALLTPALPQEDDMYIGSGKFIEIPFYITYM